jgi:hypothetical protein
MHSRKPSRTALRKEREEKLTEREREREERFENRVVIMRLLCVFFAVIAYATIAVTHYGAYRLSSRGVAVNADARFLNDYVVRGRRRFRYELSFAGYVSTTTLPEPFAGSKVDVVYDPDNPHRWTFGRAGDPFFTILENVLDGSWGSEVVLLGLASATTFMVVAVFRSPRRNVRY